VRDGGLVSFMSKQSMELVWPAEEYLASYIHALEQGWSPDNLRPEAAGEHLARIAQDRDRFLAEQIDREAKGPPVILPDGSTVQRLPGYARWIWDGEFCGSISFRWQPGTAELPPYCLGHVGYAVVEWKRDRGYATRALELLLPETREAGLPYIELVAEPDNVASQRVIEANGGKLVERFRKSAEHGGKESLRFRIVLNATSPRE
jgi:predicted acetyltransferase